MLHIAVCDDENLYVNKLEHIIMYYAEQKKISINIEKYNDGSELLNDGKGFDLIFLDIEMNQTNGIEVASEIRKFDSNVPIVYVTSYSDYWRRAYKVHAFDFILKPFKKEDIFRVLTDFLAFIRDTDDRTVELLTENGIEIQPLNEIYYFIVLAKKTIQVSTVLKEYIVKENLSDIFIKLNDERFYMSNRSCIINLNYVQTLEKNEGIFMTNGDWVPLAQKKQKDFFLQLSKYLRR